MAETKLKSFAEAKAVYDGIAKQCIELNQQLPKLEREIAARVRKEMGDHKAKLADLMAKKAAAAKEMHAAEERERPARAKREADAEAARVEADNKKRAEANAARHREQEKAATQRLADATK